MADAIRAPVHVTFMQSSRTGEGLIVFVNSVPVSLPKVLSSVLQTRAKNPVAAITRRISCHAHFTSNTLMCRGGEKKNTSRWFLSATMDDRVFDHLRTDLICARLVLLQIAGRGACANDRLAEMYYIHTQLGGSNYSKVSRRCLLIVSRPEKQNGAKNSFVRDTFNKFIRWSRERQYNFSSFAFC